MSKKNIKPKKYSPYRKYGFNRAMANAWNDMQYQTWLIMDEGRPKPPSQRELVPEDTVTGEYVDYSRRLTEHQLDLLKKEISARIKYGLKVYDGNLTSEPIIVLGIDYSKQEGDGVYLLTNVASVEISQVKPYLRPLSEMTDSEWTELDEAIMEAGGIGYNHKYNDTTSIVYIDFMLKHRFDYRGLIDMGLAIKASKEMYEEFYEIS